MLMSACYTGIILVKMNSVDIVMTEADMSMLNTSISVGKIYLRKRQTQVRVYTGIILVTNELIPLSRQKLT